MPYEVVVRGPEVHLAFDEVLDSLVMDHPDVITVEGLEGFPLPAMKAGLTAECQDTAGVWHATVVRTAPRALARLAAAAQEEDR